MTDVSPSFFLPWFLIAAGIPSVIFSLTLPVGLLQNVRSLRVSNFSIESRRCPRVSTILVSVMLCGVVPIMSFLLVVWHSPVECSSRSPHAQPAPNSLDPDQASAGSHFPNLVCNGIVVGLDGGNARK